MKYATIKSFHDMISPCFDLAIDDNILRKNPCNGCLKEFKKDADKRISLFKKEQIVFLDFVRTSKTYSVYYPLIIFMLGTGARCGETIGLTWNNVDFRNKEIIIDHQLIYKKTGNSYGFYDDSPKTDSGVRVIPMTTEVYRVQEWQRQESTQKYCNTSWGTAIFLLQWTFIIMHRQNETEKKWINWKR